MKQSILKTLFVLFVIVMSAFALTCCKTVPGGGFQYHYADRDEAVEIYLSDPEFFEQMNLNNIQYRMQDKDVDIEQFKEFGVSQMMEFSEKEKAALDDLLSKMYRHLKKCGYTLPELGEITLIRTTGKEECYASAYTMGAGVFLGDGYFSYVYSDDEEYERVGEFILWHEIFHCLTKRNPQFRKDMYKLIHFTITNYDFDIPSVVLEKKLSNPDVEHHDSYATFRINGEDIDCFMVAVLTKPFEETGDNFFDYSEAVLVPIDGRNIYYSMDDAENFWEIMGENTDYVDDPEECMADNFAVTLCFGQDGYNNSPEIIDGIIEYLSTRT